jgi:signal transduction histidine kinase
MDRLTVLLAAEASTLFMYDQAKNELWSRILKGSSLNEIRVPAGSGLVGSVMKDGKTLVLADAYDDARFNPEVDRLSGFKTRSVIAVPLQHVSGRMLGVIEVLDRKINAFSPEDVSLVETVAAQIAAVLDNVFLLEELRVQNDELRKAQAELSLLYEMEQAVSSTQSQADLLDTILRKGIEVIGAQAGSILLLEEEANALFFRAVRGERSEALTSMSLRSGQGIAGRVAETGQPIRVDDAESSELYDPSVASKLGITVRALLAVPIPGEQRNLGALELLNKPGGFTEADERMAALLAGQTGRAILLRAAREAGERKGRLEAIGQMLSGMLHDLRTPMTVISGYAQLMASEESPEERAANAKVIGKQVEHINSMTRETLAFARGEREILLRKVYLQAFIKEVEEFLRKDFDSTGVELKVVANYTGAARVDESKMKRVVYNIARNAVQAMPDGGQFTIQVDREGDELVMRFADNGPGIPPEIEARLFESFVTAGKANGTGLGLAIVKKIAEEHGGRVTYQTRRGEGTSFEVRVPAGLPP